MIKKNLPRHVAIIMDGNGRWAKKHGRPRWEGHFAGGKAVKRIVTISRRLGIKILTLFAFSTENWNRPQKEIQTLMKLLHQYIQSEREEMIKNNIRLIVSGKLGPFPQDLQRELNEIARETGKNDGMILNIALNYGGRQEIISAVRGIAKEIYEHKYPPEKINESLFRKHLYHNLPDPDLLIRTSGELRISNFLLWQIAYTELYVTRTLWPDFRGSDLRRAIAVYQKRERRFGKIA